jgi:hypothetical protein
MAKAAVSPQGDGTDLVRQIAGGNLLFTHGPVHPPI